MSTAETGILTSLPVLAFAVFGALAPRGARLVGLHRLTLLALLCVVGGLAGRGVTSSVPVFLVLSLLALAGMASANVLLPSLVKLHFPNQIGLMTAVYSTALAIGLTSASVLTVPIGEAQDGWRSGLTVWAVTAGIAVLPWLALVAHDRRPEEAEGHIGLLDVARTRLGWLMALFFGLQSLQAYAVFGWFAELYRDAGFSAYTAGIAAGGDHRREHPAVDPDPVAGRARGRPEAADVPGDGLLPDRLPRAGLRPARRRRWPGPSSSASGCAPSRSS